LPCRHVLAVWRDVVQQLLRWSVRLGCEHVHRKLHRRLSRRYVQSRWRDVVHELQCRLRVPCWLDIVNTSSSHLPSRYFQRVRRDVM
jgi:hypothetical protein